MRVNLSRRLDTLETAHGVGVYNSVEMVASESKTEPDVFRFSYGLSRNRELVENRDYAANGGESNHIGDVFETFLRLCEGCRQPFGYRALELYEWHPHPTFKHSRFFYEDALRVVELVKQSIAENYGAEL